MCAHVGSCRRPRHHPDVYNNHLSSRSRRILLCHLHAPVLTFPVSFHSPPADPSDQLRLHGAGAERRPAVRLLLSGGPSGQLPGSGHGGHCQDHGLELRLNGGVGRQLRREGRGRLHAALQRGR